MSVFQGFLIATLGMFLIATVFGLWRGWASRRVLFGWSVLSCAGLAAVIWPDSTTLIANALGIERGTDLLAYCTTLTVLIGFFMLYIRLRRVRRDLTILTRKIAMLEIHEDHPIDDMAGSGADEKP